MSTQRTKAALDALFADNATGAITPSRLRDFVESALPSTGGIHLDTPGSLTAIAAPSTFVKVAGTTSLHGGYRVSMPANNRLQYDGTETVNALALYTIAFTAETDDQKIAFGIAVNGVVVASSVSHTTIAVGADVQAITVIGHPTLAPGDYVELWVANETSAGDVTVERFHGQLLGFLT